MIPLRDEKPSGGPPLATLALLGMCAAGFAAELAAGPALEATLERRALVPARLFALARREGPLAPDVWSPLVTSIFLHAGWLHLLGNGLYLWVFGPRVERWLGAARYLVFFLAGGAVAGLAHAAAAPTSLVPTLGASGAIAALMGAYFVRWPQARVSTLLVLPFFVRTVALRAWLYLGLWIAWQLAAATTPAAAPDEGGVAWWAHVAGFALGAGVALALWRRD
jgi:membrane associated rhomboid family serine protease